MTNTIDREASATGAYFSGFRRLESGGPHLHGWFLICILSCSSSVHAVLVPKNTNPIRWGPPSGLIWTWLCPQVTLPDSITLGVKVLSYGFGEVWVFSPYQYEIVERTSLEDARWWLTEIGRGLFTRPDWGQDLGSLAQKEDGDSEFRGLERSDLKRMVDKLLDPAHQRLWQDWELLVDWAPPQARYQAQTE